MQLSRASPAPVSQQRTFNYSPLIMHSSREGGTMIKLGNYLIATVFILCFTWSTAAAEVTGGTYATTFYVDNQLSQLTMGFAPTGTMVIPQISGTGTFIDIAPAFAGVYWGPKASVGSIRGDVLIFVSGISVENSILGLGYIFAADPSYAHYNSYPFTFYGRK
jgi:hypothetical protein